MAIYRAELHVHTVLSPCAAVEMIPPLIVSEAVLQGINLIAITDHNSSDNVLAVMQAAQGTELTVLPGMEVQTSEDVHVLTLFDTLEQLAAWQEIIDRALPTVPNRPDFFGEQFVVDSTGDFLCSEERLLINATRLSLGDVLEKASSLGGLVIPAHVDRKTFGLLGTLGFVPPGLDFPALELSWRTSVQEAAIKFPQIAGFKLIQSGDVHHLEDFLGRNVFEMQAPTISEIKLALSEKEGRSHRVVSHFPGSSEAQAT